MQSQFILRMVLAMLVIEYANAETMITRGDYKFKVEYNDLYHPQFSSSDAEHLAKQLGIDLDKESQIFFHEEDRSIDISCFNCYIRHVPDNEIIENSFNEDYPGR